MEESMVPMEIMEKSHGFSWVKSMGFSWVIHGFFHKNPWVTHGTKFWPLPRQASESPMESVRPESAGFSMGQNGVFLGSH